MATGRYRLNCAVARRCSERVPMPRSGLLLWLPSNIIMWAGISAVSGSSNREFVNLRLDAGHPYGKRATGLRSRAPNVMIVFFGIALRREDPVARTA